MPSLYSMLGYLLTAMALAAKAHASPHIMPPAQVDMSSNSIPWHPVFPPPYISNEATGPQAEMSFKHSPLGISYGKCYQIGNSHQPLGGDGSAYSYYKLGGSQKRIFQVWYDRSFAWPSSYGSVSVREGDQFYLWDVYGSTTSEITNGGSWVATNLAGRTYPGFYSYNYYLQFHGKRSEGGWANPMDEDPDADRDYDCDEPGYANSNGKVTVELGVKEVSHSGAVSNYRGLKIDGTGYLQNEVSSNTVPFVFKEVACPYGRDGGDW